MTVPHPTVPLLLLLCAQIPSALPGNSSFEESGRQVDSFLERTVNRIHDAWILCGEEFRLASSCAVEESKEYVKEEVRKQTDAMLEQVKEKAVDQIRNIPREDEP